MNLQEFAERILLGKTLSEKLLQADSLEDRPFPYQKPFPHFPSRPAGLALERWHQSKRRAFPNIKNLESAKQRGIVLHFFANHELLALELIALALLKFPKAPPPFRQGLLKTLLEEQTHLALYEQRMRDFQVEFGEIPVNDFFWKCLASMENPLDFVCGMSLTLEQANLDYAQYYATVFEKIGDHPTADILKQVYQDEIGHVQHGLKWFRQWKPTHQNDWEAYQNALHFPLTPARAKGNRFNKEGRIAAGFSEEYILELSLYAQSKGRVPDIFYFNPTCEAEIAHGKPGLTASKQVAQLTADLSTIPMFLSRQDDVVLVEKKPRPPFLAKLQQAGIMLPEFVEFQRLTQSHPLQKSPLLQRKIGKLHPWGWSPESIRFLEPLHSNKTLLKKKEPLWPFFSKTWSAQQLKNWLVAHPPDSHWGCDPKIVGHPCHSLEEVMEAYQHFKHLGFEQIILKAALGASGQHRVQLFKNDDLFQKKKRIEKLLHLQKAVVVEPWLEKVLDLSFQLDVQAESKFSVVGITQFFTDSRGQYRGSVVGRFDAGLEKNLLKFLHYQPQKSQPKSLATILQSLATTLVPALVGYEGPLGVDALVYRDQNKPNSLHLKPIVEINPRFSMGRLSLELSQYLQHRKVGIWLILSLKEIQASGFQTIMEFAHTLETHFPLKMDSLRQQKISQGVLFTTDPQLAQGFTSLLLVGNSLEECTKPLNCFLNKQSHWLEPWESVKK